MLITRSPLPIFCSVLALQLSLSTGAFAQESDSSTARSYTNLLEEVITIGTRKKGRTALETTAPVDVFNSDSLAKSPSSDLNETLRTLVPSYSVNQAPVNNGSTFVRPAKLRGLPTDKTLVLINGKRRHRSAVVDLSTEGVRGAQGPDLATLPSIAVKSVEVLRDGAGAQYGSDAIAGVLNFQLKDAREGGSLKIKSGSTFEGDGDNVTVSANVGLPLGEEGFLNISGEFTDSKFTSRGEQTAAAVAYAADPANADYAAAVDLSKPVQEYGAPNSGATRIFVNAGYEINDSVSWYGFANYSDGEGDGDFYYRSPNGAGGVGNSLFEPLTDGNGNTADFNTVYPGGFTPRFYGDTEDVGLTTGILGETGDLGWDVSVQYGSNKIDYSLKETINPSLGLASPTSFYVGSLKQTEWAINTDFSYVVAVDAFSSGELSVAFGAEYRDEEYEIGAGELASYQVGPFSGPVGSNGFPGFSPDQANAYSRNSTGFYLDLEADVTDALLLNAAFRYEDFSDFGDSFDGKIAARYSITDNFNLRGSVGTGFHAPSTGQQGTINISTSVESGVATSSGTFPSSGAIAQQFGAQDLTPEEAMNYAIGFAWTPTDAVTVTVDYYRIELEDRIGLSSAFNVSDADRSVLAGLGVVNASTLGSVRYFANDFDTTTQGIDAVVTYQTENRLGGLEAQLSFNWGDTVIDRRNTRKNASGETIVTLDDEQAYDIENILPDSRLILGLQQYIGDNWSVYLRATRWGEWSNSCCGNNPTVQNYDADWLVDLDISYDITENLSVSFGGNNIFDTYPERDRVEFGGFTGQVYDLEAPYGFNGGTYYVQLGYEFY